MVAPTVRRIRPCVACHDRPRYGETYLCLTCHDDLERREQIRAAEMTTQDPEAQRRFLVSRFGWYGGWRVATR